jgi:WD40 repeat protein
VNDAIYLWTGLTGKLFTFSEQQQGPVTAVVFSQDGLLLAAGGADGTIVVGCVTFRGGQARVGCIQQVTGGFGPIEALTFSPHGNTLASASADGTVKLWQVSRGTLKSLATLTGPTQPVVGVAFSSDGTMLAASAADRTISLWNTRSPGAPSLFATITGLTTATSVAFVPGTHIVAGAAWDGTAQFWNTNPGQVAEGICQTARPNLTAVQAEIGAAFQPVCLNA